jgi:heme-binding NEAT domain protein
MMKLQLQSESRKAGFAVYVQMLQEVDGNLKAILQWVILNWKQIFILFEMIQIPKTKGSKMSKDTATIPYDITRGSFVIIV